MGKVANVEYKDLEIFHKALDKKINSNAIENMCTKILDEGMDYLLAVAETNTPVQTGELKKSWYDNVEAVTRDGKKYSKTATNLAYNEEAAEYFNDAEMGYYARFVEEGHKKVPWRKSTRGVHMLRQAEEHTRVELQDIVDKEVRKFLGDLFV